MTTLIYIMAIIGTVQTTVVTMACLTILYIIFKSEKPAKEIVNATAV